MRLDLKLLGLPVSLLLVVVSQANAAPNNDQSPAPWLSNLLPHAKRLPAEAPKESRNEQVVLGSPPAGVMKMSDDPGEKFYMEYWQYEGALAETSIPAVSPNPLRARDLKEEVRLLANASSEISFRPPFALHTDNQDLRFRRSFPGLGGAALLAILEKRDFTCPAGTSACSGSSTACCATGETCFTVADTGLGTIGCCPNGMSCTGTITSCNSPNTPCANGGTGYEPGGCCIPNYVCAGVGCVINPSFVVTVVVTETFTVSGSTSTQTSTTLTTSIPTTSSATTTVLQTTSVCSTSWNACPASFGGGCCQDGYTCAPDRSCTIFSSTSTSGLIAPVRPTDTASSTTTFSTTTDSGTCPTGFYACSAYYRGGCCRTGRDCQTTSCPPTSSTTIVSGSATIVVAVDSAATVATPTGQCAGGWSTCAASLGGNCCPTGYDCGTASCSLVSATQTSVVQKGSPNSGTRNRSMWSVWGLGLLTVFVLV